DPAAALSSGVDDRLAPRCARVRPRGRHLAARSRPLTLPARPSRAAADLGANARAAIGIRAGRRSSAVLGALNPADQRAALLHHFPDAALVIVISAGRRQATALYPQLEHGVGEPGLVCLVDDVGVRRETLERFADARALDPHCRRSLLAMEWR